MIETFALSSGVTLRCFRDHRFKQGAISIQLVRPMTKEEVTKAGEAWVELRCPDHTKRRDSNKITTSPADIHMIDLLLIFGMMFFISVLYPLLNK